MLAPYHQHKYAVFEETMLFIGKSMKILSKKV